jgi:predicted transcriptional regulator
MKVGDKVRVTDVDTGHHYFKAGSTVEVTHICGGGEIECEGRHRITGEQIEQYLEPEHYEELPQWVEDEERGELVKKAEEAQKAVEDYDKKVKLLARKEEIKAERKKLTAEMARINKELR